ncbi:MAG: PAS domain-containing protein, partial [Calditrichia bacterium]
TETRWNSLVENTQDLIIIMNKSGKIRFSNRILYTTHGKKARTIFDITAAKSENIFLTAVKEVYRHKNHELIEIPLYTRGEEKQWYKIRIAPILRDHKVMAVICTAKDVSELKAKENKKFLLEEAIHAVNDSVIITDMENKIIFVNRTFSEIYGYREEEVLGQTIDLIRSKLTSTLIMKEALAATLQGGWKGKVYHRKKDGSDFPVFVRNSIIKNKNERPVAIIRSIRLLSEVKKVNEKPRHPDQVQDQQSQEIEFN